MRLRCGFLGAGRVAHVHAAALAAMPEVATLAVADPRPGAAEAFADRFGIPHRFTSHDELLASGLVEAVDIAIPHDQHAAVARAALQAGVHVFMDKPLALDSRQGADLCALADSRPGQVFMLCHNLLFHPTVRRARTIIAEGLLGRPTVADAWSTGWLDLKPWDFRLRRATMGGGCWIDNAPHLIYVLEDLIAPLTGIRCLPNIGESRLEGEDAACAVARFSGGATATLRISYADRLPGHQSPWPEGWAMGFELHGTAGALRCEVLPRPHLAVFDGSAGWRTEDLSGATFEDSFRSALEEFVAAIHDGRPPAITASDALHVLELTEEALQ